MGIGGVISAVIVGLVIGYLGKLVAPGRQNIPVWLTLVVGIVAAFIGTFVARAIGVADTKGIDWIEIIIQVVIAAIGVSLAAGFYGKRSVR
ncbi:GlsB/YeaQ/YmgE family stress response membrane protein [Actinosynnema sp. NPDC020468]|uniref:GlsB/YeaQ/YmgE family stress response membrane protein n=1 Tax=Actinosynnema sp. NPDC020468 TaxID=3154488 RepID=UPI0033FB2587